MKEFIIVVVSLMLVFVPNKLFENYLKDTGNDLISVLEDMDNDLENPKELDTITVSGAAAGPAAG